MDLDALVAEASVILDAAAKPFVAGHRADSAVSKRGDDFATEVDLAIERQVVDALVAATGIPVHGEEFGGADLDSPWVWVLDPVDGTFNYAAGSPMAAILLGLLRDGNPVAGLTWLPFMSERYTAVSGGPVMKTACRNPAGQSRTQRRDHRRRHVQRRLPRPVPRAVPDGGARRAQPGVSRMRMHGATGIDLAYVADGVLGGAISFGDHVWDHAAGVALVRAAGGVVTDLAGEEWTPDVAVGAGRRARRARPDPRHAARRRTTRGVLNLLAGQALRFG